MKTTCFAIVLLLAVAFVVADASLMSEHEIEPKSRIEAGLQKSLNGLIKRDSKLSTLEDKESVGEEKDEHDNKKKSGQVAGNAKACITKQDCMKRKVTCTKKCTNSLEKERGKCAVKCTKCIPTC